MTQNYLFLYPPSHVGRCAHVIYLPGKFRLLQLLPKQHSISQASKLALADAKDEFKAGQNASLSEVKKGHKLSWKIYIYIYIHICVISLYIITQSEPALTFHAHPQLWPTIHTSSQQRRFVWKLRTKFFPIKYGPLARIARAIKQLKRKLVKIRCRFLCFVEGTVRSVSSQNISNLCESSCLLNCVLGFLACSKIFDFLTKSSSSVDYDSVLEPLLR